MITISLIWIIPVKNIEKSQKKSSFTLKELQVYGNYIFSSIENRKD